MNRIGVTEAQERGCNGLKTSELQHIALIWSEVIKPISFYANNNRCSEHDDGTGETEKQLSRELSGGSAVIDYKSICGG